MSYIEDQVIELIEQRAKFGLNKYNVDMMREDLDLEKWLQHALEECLDQAIYLRRAIHELHHQEDGPNRFCLWRMDREGIYTADCKFTFLFTHETEDDNFPFKFCPGCGKPIIKPLDLSPIQESWRERTNQNT